MTKNSAVSESTSTALAPMLSVRNGAVAVDFYKTAFGASEILLLDGDDGGVVAEFQIGASHFWIADESPEHLNFSPESLGGSSARMVLIVDDPDAVFNRAVAAGAVSITPVLDQPYGWRVGRVVDPFGHHWEIGKPLRQ